MSNKKLIIIMLNFVLVQNIFAYLDPGTWSYVLQILMMLFVGGIVAIKTFWSNVKDFIINIFKKK